MIEAEFIPLVDALKQCSALWVERSGATHARLGRSVVNDGGFFSRLETQPRGTTTDTLERFARFLALPDNWPEGEVPEEVLSFAGRVGISMGLPA